MNGFVGVLTPTERTRKVELFPVYPLINSLQRDRLRMTSVCPLPVIKSYEPGFSRPPFSEDKEEYGVLRVILHKCRRVT